MVRPLEDKRAPTGDIVLIVNENLPDSNATPSINDGAEAFVPLSTHAFIDESHQIESSLKMDASDDHTEETCEASSRCSSQSHDEEMGQDLKVSTACTADIKNSSEQMPHWVNEMMWLTICFFGIMASFVAYGILLEYATTGDRRLHELSFLLVTSVLATVTAWTGRTIKRETVTDIPATRFLMLGLMSLGSTFCAIRSLRYVIFPIQVLARSCKPVPVLLIGTLLGKKYPRRKYISVFLVVCGVALFMGGGNILKGGDSSDSSDSSDALGSSDTETASQDEVADGNEPGMAPMHQQIFGVALLIASLFFDGGTGAYEDKLMSMHSVEPFDLMFKFQLSKSILAALALVVFNQMNLFVEMIQQTGFYIVALGLCSAVGQVFIFITIAKFGALTCSLMSLTRKVTTLTASIIIYDHDLSGVQLLGLLVALGAMIMNFFRPKSESAKAVAGGSEYASLPTQGGEEDARDSRT